MTIVKVRKILTHKLSVISLVEHVMVPTITSVHPVCQDLTDSIKAKIIPAIVK